MRTYVFDIDGTVSNADRRKHYLDRIPKDWDAFFDEQHLDEPHEHIVEILRMLYVAGNHIVFATGRREDSRGITTAWLRKNGIPFEALYMRATDDRRDDSVIKIEQLEKIRADSYDVVAWFEDRNRVVNALRAAGVKVLHVADGDF